MSPPSKNAIASRWSLQARLLAGVVLLIVLCMGAAILATTFFGNQVAESAIEEALSKSQTVQARFAQLRLEQLEAQASWFGRDPAIISYFQEAVDSNSTVSLLDLLAEYQRDVGFDLAVVLDADGFLVARTDRPEAEPVDMFEESLVEIAFDEGSASGFWLDAGTLYTAVAVPLTEQFDLVGFLIMAYRLDDVFAAEVERLSSAEIAYLVEGDAGLAIAESTLSPAEESRLLVQVRSMGGLSSVLGDDGRVEITLGNEVFSGLAAPLRDPAGERLGATVALASRRERTADLISLQRVLWAVGLISLALGLGLAILLSRRLLSPVRRLVSAAESVREGNYDVEFEAGGSDEVGRLSRSFAGLLGQLRAEKELQAFVRQLSRSLPEPGEVASTAAPEGTRSLPAAIGAIDLRGTFAEVGLDHADALAEKLEADLRRVQAQVVANGGEMVALLGHRLYVVFEGVDHAARAVVALSDCVRSLAEATNSFYEPQPPIVAVTTGRLLVSRLRVGSRRQLTVAGPAVQQLDGLLREASPGDFILSRSVQEAVGADLTEAAVELKHRESLLSTLDHFLVDAGAVSRSFKPALRETQDQRAQDGETMAMNRGPLAGEHSGIEPGTIIGERYEILSVLGSGGMGVVYKARDRELADLVALKALRRSLVRQNTVGSETAQSLKEELRLARKVTHPNVLRTYDFQVIDGQPLISMEYVRGITLRYMMDRSGGIPRTAGLRVLQQLCAGLGAAHEQGVLHCDIKPENIILEADGNAKLMDFGIARPLARKRGRDEQVLGTPYYMAPEQITGGDVDERSDVYACGVVAYELFVGRLPFAGKTAKEVFRSHLDEAPKPPREVVPELPEWLEAAILKCLAKDPSKRFAGADELEQALNG